MLGWNARQKRGREKAEPEAQLQLGERIRQLREERGWSQEALPMKAAWDALLPEPLSAAKKTSA